MLTKISLHPLTDDDSRQFKADTKQFYYCFHELRQAHITLASLIADPRRNFDITESIIEENADLFARLFDLERDYVKFINKVRTINKVAK